jgi:hypothetical protein
LQDPFPNFRERPIHDSQTSLTPSPEEPVDQRAKRNAQPGPGPEPTPEHEDNKIHESKRGRSLSISAVDLRSDKHDRSYQKEEPRTRNKTDASISVRKEKDQKYEKGGTEPQFYYSLMTKHLNTHGHPCRDFGRIIMSEVQSNAKKIF